jgi:release factor glutamine methyltransferase
MDVIINWTGKRERYSRKMAIVIKNALNICEEMLKDAGVESPLADAEILLSHMLNWPRWKIWANVYGEIPADTYLEYMKIISKRVQRIPLPYITGHKEFFSRDFFVNENVLIPRPETELLVEEAIKYIIDFEIKNVTEIGTGSGAIAVSIAMDTDDAHIIAVDISQDALNTAKINIDRYAMADKITLVQGNLLIPLINQQLPEPEIIIANLPYVPLNDIDTLEPEVKNHEPKIALFAGPDGLDTIKELIMQASSYCKEGTILGLEFGIGQEIPITDFLKINGWNIEKIICDYSGIIRHIFAKFAV